MKYNQTIVALTLGAACAAQAQTNQPAASAPAPTANQSAFEQTIADIKHPVSWFSWGGDFRIRNEYFDNAQTLGAVPQAPGNPAALNKVAPLAEQDYFRLRGRVWASLFPIDDLSFNSRLAAEPRDWMKPSSSGTFLNQEGMQWNYGIFDNMNAKWVNIGGLPATLIVGRQDIALNDGWLVMDGTPKDGSWTFFLDSARLTYDLKDQDTKIDAIGIVQYAQANEWMPVINDSNNFLTDQDEKGAILSVANTSIKELNMNGYFIYKHDTRLNESTQGKYGDNANIYTLGGRVSGLVCDHWQYAAEGAYQLGDKQDPALTHSVGGANVWRDLSAFGVNSKLVYQFNDKLSNQLGLYYEFMTGDNPNTQEDEMFDVLWGRYPRWSEMYNVYSYVYETRVGQFENFHRIGPGWTISPMENMQFIANYYALIANQEVPTRATFPTLFNNQFDNSGHGNFRGHYLQAVLKYKFNQHISGHLWSEFLFPGDFYANEKMMDFLRAELLFTF